MTHTTPSRRISWIHFLAGPVLWFIHFNASYLLVEAFCQLGWNLTIFGINTLSFIIAVLTALAVLVTGLFGRRSYRSWKHLNKDRRLRDELADSSSWFEGASEFMHFTGFLLSLLFAVAILAVGIPVLFLRPCG